MLMDVNTRLGRAKNYTTILGLGGNTKPGFLFRFSRPRTMQHMATSVGHEIAIIERHEKWDLHDSGGYMVVESLLGALPSLFPVSGGYVCCTFLGAFTVPDAKPD